MNSANDVTFDVAFEANQNVLCTMRASRCPHGMTRLAQMILIINSNQAPYPSDDILVQGCLDNAKHPKGVL
ncbi:MAG: hypothetical protein AXW12_08065 [Thalassospira sp. Nap_22]|nr:MAG: hypothetical protein AXW12_08065 [Thalassospira sp. Nap_22]